MTDCLHLAHPLVSISVSPDLETNAACLQTIQSIELVDVGLAHDTCSGENYFYKISLKPNNLLLKNS